MDKIETYIVEKFNLNNLNIKIPKFYKSIKEETKTAYLLLSYMYYKIFNNKLNIDDITKDENNKPIFINKDFYFNISHSKNYVACSVAPVNIGIDIEEDRNIKLKTIEKIKNYEDINENIIEVWNIKEAYSKYLGIGLKLDFSKVSINEIEKKVNLKKSVYNINNNNIYYAICYDKKYILNNNILFIPKEELIFFVS